MSKKEAVERINKPRKDKITGEEVKPINSYLTTDLDAAYITDKASKSKKEIVYTYPGFYVTILYRFANLLYKQKVEILPRLICLLSALYAPSNSC